MPSAVSANTSQPLLPKLASRPQEAGEPPAAAAPNPAAVDLFAPAPNVAGVAQVKPTLSSPVDLQALFESIPLGTAWANVPEATRAKLEGVARQRLSTFDAAWGPQGLKAKQHVLQDSPTPEMTKALDDFALVLFPNQLPADFKASEGFTHDAVTSAFKDLFLATSALARSTSGRYGGIAQDWDGAAFKEIPLPSRTAIEASKHLAACALEKLQSVPDGDLNEAERSIRGRLELKLTSLATGSFGSALLGGDTLLTPYGRVGWGYDVNDEMSPNSAQIYKDRKQEFLEDATAYWLGTDLENVNAGSVASTVDFLIPLNHGEETLKATIGDPNTDPMAKAASLLAHWFGERVSQHADAGKKGWQLSPAQKDTMWKSLQADLMIPRSSQGSVEDFQKSLDTLTHERTQRFKEAAKTAVEAIFPPGSPELSDAARAKVLSDIEAQPTFGTLKPALFASLDAATGNTAASDKLKAELETVGTLGGYATGEPVKPEDAAKLQAMWQQVKAFIARHYSGGKFDLAGLLQNELQLTTDRTSSTDRTGNINIDLQPAESAAQLYSTMLHEAKHAVDFLTHLDKQVEGAAWEGAATLVEERLGTQLLDEVYAGDPKTAALAKFALIDQEISFSARTEAAAAAFAAKEGEDGVEIARKVGEKWGLEPEMLDVIVHRAFNGLQYLQYKLGTAISGDLMDYLQKEIGPTSTPIDPFVLQMHGLGTAGKDAATVQRLKEALKLPQ